MAGDRVFVPAVFDDLDEAITWYEGRRLGLGREWFASVNECLTAITKSPLVYPIIFGPCRRALVHRFPYAIFYEVLDGRVVVYAIMHTSVHPRKWRKRLPP
jgi:plasmid stabilization system protein ParE